MERPDHPDRAASRPPRLSAALRRVRPGSRLMVVGAIPVIALIAAACGSSTPSSSSTTSTAPASAPTTASAAAVVKVGPTAHFGSILVDAQGRTLYTLTSNGVAVACTGACTSVWPPLTLPAGETAPTGGTGVSGLGTTSANGADQVTDHGLPLYRFAGDSTPGATGGDGIVSFGGTWHVVKVGATGAPAASSSAATTPPTTSTTSSGSSGY